MCVFCAAIPATAAAGARLNFNQNRAARERVAKGEKLSPARPILKATLILVLVLAVCSVIYHTVLFPILRI
jgi:hypothetical protein